MNLRQEGIQLVEFRRNLASLPVWMRFVEASLAINDTPFHYHRLAVFPGTDLDMLWVIFAGKSGFLTPSRVVHLTKQQ